MRMLLGTILAASLVCAASGAETVTADVAVVGGGSAGFAAALSAATLGGSVVVIEKESVLGGTSTIGGVSNWEPVWGATGVPWRVYDRLRRIPKAAGVYEFAHHCTWPEAGGGPGFPGALLTANPDIPYEKTLRRHGPGMDNEAWFRENCHGVIFEPKAMSDTMAAMLRETGRCQLLLGTTCVGVEREGGRVAALRLSDGRVVRAKVVVDACSAVCAMMGCEMMRGREAKSAFNEPGAPDGPSARMNGATLVYRVAPRGDGAEVLHALPGGVPEKCWWGNFPYAFCCMYPNGDIGVNMLPTMTGDEAQRLGEWGAYEECRRRVHAHWRWMQGRWPDFRKYRLKEIAPVLALRETARVRGEYVLNQNDLIAGMSGQRHDDIIALADHCMDSHGGGGPGGELKEPYGIPYRCLLPRGTDNVLIAGRCASFSSIAASSCRLARTMMQLGEAAGAAAYLSVKRGVSLREVPAADIRAAMAVLDRRDGAAASPVRRRLVLADESRAKVHYYDSSDPAKCFSVAVEKPVWDLKRVADGKYRIVCRNGFMVVDMDKRKVVDTFRHPALDEVTAVCDLPDGGFVASVNPRSGELNGRAILVLRFSKDRKLVSSHAFRGIFHGRTLTRLDNGELLLAQDQGFTRGRLPDGDGDGIILQHFKQPAGRNLFDVEPARDGNGYWAGTGYGAQLVRFAKDGRVVSAWQAPPAKGLQSVFYAQPQEMPDGHVYIANWTGHDAQDSNRGWQVIEFDEKGKVVWTLHDPATFGSVSGVIVLETPSRN